MYQCCQSVTAFQGQEVYQDDLESSYRKRSQVGYACMRICRKRGIREQECRGVPEWRPLEMVGCPQHLHKEETPGDVGTKAVLLQ
eukprot:354386-Chlamydomonas_euryale.AAC.3